MAIEDEVRPGIAGAWDRFAGPRQSRIEQAGTIAAVAAGTLWGDHALDHGSPLHCRLLMRLAAVDLWGGAWVNNTPSCVRWYERPGQGVGEHVGFAAVHLLHAGMIGYTDAAVGNRSRGSALRWVLAHYAWMLGSATVITAAPRRARLPIALAATTTGLGLDRALGPAAAAPWFAPIYYTKLLIGHAAGSVWTQHSAPLSSNASLRGEGDMSETLNVAAVVLVGLMVGVELAVAAFVNPIFDRLPTTAASRLGATQPGCSAE